MKQWCRAYLNAKGEIIHLHTRGTPIRDSDPEPVIPGKMPTGMTPEQVLHYQENHEIKHVWDFEIEDGDPKPLFAEKLRQMLRAGDPDRAPRMIPFVERPFGIQNAKKRK